MSRNGAEMDAASQEEERQAQRGQPATDGTMDG